MNGNFKKDSLGTRMKTFYEGRSQTYLNRRTPVILRLDGKAFHTLTRKCVKPYDEQLSDAMIDTAMKLVASIQGAKIAYTQSDEISILLTDFDTLTTEAWYDNNMQKICSVAAGIASAHFTVAYYYGPFHTIYSEKKAGVFDCRAFNLPKEEVQNYFLWRYNDWVRNSISMLAQAHFSHKQLHQKNQTDMHDMLHKKGVNWVKLEPRWKNGTFIYRTSASDKAMIIKNFEVNLKMHTNFLEQFLLTEEEREESDITTFASRRKK
jgi:tRNA(His) guanylyltransferase